MPAQMRAFRRRNQTVTEIIHMTPLQDDSRLSTADDWLVFLFCIAIFGSAILPLVPIWTGVTTAIAVVWLLLRSDIPYRALVGTLLVITNAAYIAAWVAALVTSPDGLFIDGLLHYYGMPLGLTANSAQLAGQLLLTMALALEGWRRGARRYRLFLSACLLFAAWGALSAVWNAASGTIEVPAEAFAAASIWAHWGALAILGSLLLDSRAAFIHFLKFVVAAAALIAASLLAQSLLKDFSYVLVTADSDSLFARARSTYYYHAPPVQFLAFAFPIVALLLARRERPLPVALVAILIGFMLVINGTRGISLATCAGVGAFGLFLMLKRGRRDPTALISLALAGVVASGIFYVKPGYYVDGPAAIEAGNPQKDSATPVTEDLSTSTKVLETNSYRLNLARFGFEQAVQHPFLGLGPANGRIVLPHNQSNQQRYEISSHILLVDLAMMGGILSALAFAAIFAIPGLAALARLIRRPVSEETFLQAGVLAALAVFGLSTLFHPQERSFIIAVAAALAGALAGSMSVAPPPMAEQVRTRLHRALGGTAIAGLTLAMAAWLFLASPNYVFPVIEFIARYRSEISADTPIYTTNRTFTRLLGAGLRLAGVNQLPQTLVDDPARLPTRSGFIIWRPSDESSYPRLREALGPAKPPRFGQWMSVTLLPSWTLINNYQPSVQFLRVGAFPNIEILVTSAEGEAVSPDAPLRLRLQPAEMQGFDRFFVRFESSNESEAMVRWSFDEKADQASGTIAPGETIAIPVPAGATRFYADADSPGVGRIFVTALLRSLPSIAHLAQVRMWVGGREVARGTARKIADLLDTRDVSWRGDVETVVELELNAPTHLAAYRLLPQIDGPAELPAPKSWVLEGLADPAPPVVLDKQTLAAAPPYGVGFGIPGDALAFQTYRFVFQAGEDVLLRIRELELYPAAPRSDDAVSRP